MSIEFIGILIAIILGIGTIIFVTAKFFSKFFSNLEDAKQLKKGSEKTNKRIANLEKELIKVSGDLIHLEKRMDNYFEKGEKKK